MPNFEEQFYAENPQVERKSGGEENPDYSTLYDIDEATLKRWKQGKFLGKERENFLFWSKNGKPDFTTIQDSRPKEEEPVVPGKTDPVQPTAAPAQVNPGPSVSSGVSSQPAATLAPTGTTVNTALNGNTPTAATGTVAPTTDPAIEPIDHQAVDTQTEAIINQQDPSGYTDPIQPVGDGQVTPVDQVPVEEEESNPYVKKRLDLLGGIGEDTVARFKQGKFKTEEKKLYQLWDSLGRPEFTDIPATEEEMAELLKAEDPNYEDPVKAEDKLELEETPLVLEDGEEVELPDAVSLLAGVDEATIANFKQGKFTTDQKRLFQLWQAAGQPAYTEIPATEEEMKAAIAGEPIDYETPFGEASYTIVDDVMVLEDGEEIELPDATKLLAGTDEFTIRRFQQGKFTMAEKKLYQLWNAAGRPAFEDIPATEEEIQKALLQGDIDYTEPEFDQSEDEIVEDVEVAEEDIEDDLDGIPTPEPALSPDDDLGITTTATTGTTGTTTIDDEEVDAQGSEIKTPEQIAAEEAIKDKPFHYYQNRLAEEQENFQFHIDNDEAFQGMQETSKEFAIDQLKEFLPALAEKYGYGTDEYYAAAQEKFNELFQANLKEIGGDERISQLWDARIEVINNEIQDGIMPDWVQDSKFGREFFRTMMVRFPKGIAGFSRIINSDHLRNNISYRDAYTGCLDEDPPTCTGTDSVTVVTGQRRTADGNVDIFKTMTIQEARDYYDKQINTMIQTEAEIQGFTNDMNVYDNAIEAGYNLEDGIGFDDFWGLLGSSAPYMLTMMAGAPGSMAVAMTEAGNIYSDNMDELARMKCNCAEPGEEVYLGLIESGEDGGGIALISGILVAAAEKIGFDSMMGKAFSGNGLKMLLRGEIKKFIAQKAANIFTGTFGEFLTESLQTFIEQSAGSAIQGTNKYNIKEIIQSGLAGAFVGGPITTVGQTATTAIQLISKHDPVLKVPGLDNKTIDNLGLAREDGTAARASEAVQTTTANNKAIGNTMNVSKEAFNIGHQVKMHGLQIEHQLAKTPEQENQIRDLQFKELDMAEAYNQINSDQFSHIKGRAKKKAGTLLFERNQLARQANSGTGLDTSTKERIKVIDEKLNTINTRSKSGYASTTLEKIRKAIGPKRSVGAARAATVPQKIIDRVDELVGEGVKIADAISRLDDAVGQLDITADERQRIIDHLKAELPKFEKSGASSFGQYTARQTEAQGEFSEGATTEEIKANDEKAYSKPVSERSVNDVITDMTMATDPAAKRRLTGEALQQKALDDQFKNLEKNDANNDLRNLNYAEARIKTSAKKSESAENALSRDKSEAGSVLRQALQEFADLRRVIDGQVRKMVNNKFNGKWDALTNKALELNEQYNNETDPKAKKALKAEIKAVTSDIKSYYALGLGHLENMIAKEGAKTNTYPKYFTIVDPDTGAGRINLKFQPPFGNDVLYDMFPEGALQFDSLDPGQWKDVMIRYMRYQKTGKASDGAKVQAKIDEYVKKGIDTTGTVKFDKAAELRKKRAALKDAKQAGIAVTKEVKTSDVVEKEFTSEDATKAELRWSYVSRDPKILLEGEILYKHLVAKEDITQDLADLARVVGPAAVIALQSQMNSIKVSTDINASPSVAKMQLVQQLLFNQTDGTLASSEILSDPKAAELLSMRARIGELQAQLDTMEDGPAKVETRLKVVKLKEHADALAKNAQMDNRLPVMETALLTDNEIQGDGNVLSVAALAIQGNTRLITDFVGDNLDLGTLPHNMTMSELKQYMAAFEHLSKDISQILEKQRQYSNQVKVLGIGRDISETLDDNQMNNINTLLSQSEQLDSKLAANRELQLDAARLIAGVQLGKIKVAGLKGPLSNYRLKLQRTSTKGVTKNTSPRLRKQIKFFEKKVAELETKALALRKKFEGVDKVKQITDAELDELGKVENDLSLAMFDLDSLRGALEVQSKINDLELDGSIADIEAEYEDPASKAKLKKIQEGAEETYQLLEEEMDNLKIEITSSKGYHEALNSIDNATLINAMTDGLLSLYKKGTNLTEDGSIETEGLDAQNTFAGFVGAIMNALPMENKTEAAYVASYMIGRLQTLGVIEKIDPKFHKDSATIEVVDHALMDNIIFGNTLKNIEASDKQLARQQQLYSQPRNFVEKWTGHKHPDGSAAVSKMQKGDRMTMEDSPNAYRLLNVAKSVQLQANRDVIKVYKTLLLTKHPNFTATQKNYTADQRAGKVREIKSITEKGDKLGTKTYHSNFKFGSRGRLYSTISYFNHQAAKEANGAIMLGGSPREIGPVGWKWLLADVAENAGIQAGTLQELANGTLANIEEWVKWANDPITYADQIFGDKDGKGGMDNPPVFLASVLELHKALKHAKKYGDVTTYQSNYVPYIDATVSGAQNIGSLLKSRMVMYWVNGLPGHQKMDLYSEVFANLIDKGQIITDANATPEQSKMYKSIKAKLEGFDKALQGAKKESQEAKYKIIQHIKDSNPEPTFPKGTPKPEKIRAMIEYRKALSAEIKTAMKDFRESQLKYEIFNENYGKNNAATKKNPELKTMKTIKASKFQFLLEQMKQYKETVDMDAYNGIFWGQKEWLERGRKAGKKPVMTDNYNASVNSMSDSLYKEFSVIKGVTISRSNTDWIATKLQASNQELMKPIQRFKQVMIDLAIRRMQKGEAFQTTNENGNPVTKYRDGEDITWKGKSTDFNYVRRYREPETIKLKHQNYNNPDDISQIDITVGDSNVMDERAIINGVVANVTHTLDKEIVGDLQLNFKHNKELLTIHDAFGTSLANMDELFNAIRESHAKLYRDVDGKTTLMSILEQNTDSKEEAQALHDQLFVGDWNEELIKDNQQAYGKAGSTDKQAIVKSLYERGAAASGSDGTSLANTETGSKVDTSEEAVSYEGEVDSAPAVSADVEYVQTASNIIKDLGSRYVRVAEGNKSKKIDDHISIAKDVSVASAKLSELLLGAPTDPKIFAELDAFINGPWAELMETAGTFRATGNTSSLMSLNKAALNSYLFILNSDTYSPKADPLLDATEYFNQNAEQAPLTGSETNVEEDANYPNLADEDINDNICK